MIILLGIILVCSIAVIGGDRGAIALISLTGNLIILSLIIWLMAGGISVLVLTICGGICIACITLFYQNGYNKKTRSAFVATLLTMCILSFFIYEIVVRGTGEGLNEVQLVEEEVMYYNMNLNISMQNVEMAMILLSTLGAVLDMALTVTTSLYEIQNHMPDMTKKEILFSGMQIGKHVIGTTVNTLVFAYMGESLILFLYLKIQAYSWEMLLNSKVLFQSVVSMAFGAVSCVLVIPLSAFSMTKQKENNRNESC